MNTGAGMRGFGWVPEPARKRVTGRVASVAMGTARKVLGATLLLPERGEVSRDPWILDQGSTESCTGHHGAQEIYGLTGFHASPWFVWYYGRARDGGAMSNRGVSSSSTTAALRKHGACATSEWRPGVEGFGYNVAPPGYLDVDAQRFNVDVSAVYVNRVELIVDAITRGYVPGVSVHVDRAFLDARGTEPLGPESGEIFGRHIITPWAFRVVRGEYAIGCVNSWGRDHGDGGIVWLSAARVRQSPFVCIARGVS